MSKAPEQDGSSAGPLRLEFCGEWTQVEPGSSLTLGRDADVVIDENPYLHRRFLEVRHTDGLWWLVNLGSQLSATISDARGGFQGWLAPGAHLPLVFEAATVRFTAGPTTYELTVHLDGAPFAPGPSDEVGDGHTTLGRVTFTEDQKLLVLALAEPALRPDGTSTGRVQLPSSAVAAERLGWPITKFNRKLDNVCQKLKRAGVRGLHGGPDQLASDRRARLVEYALAVRLVTGADLDLLDVT